MATEYMCSQCRTVLDESERRTHISAEHLDYFPFGCATCRKASLKLLATVEAHMNKHIATCHNSNNLGIVLLKDQAKEVALNEMVDQCIPIQQMPSNDSKSELRRALNLLDGAGTSIGSSNSVQNGPELTRMKDENGSDDDVIVIEDEIETVEMPNNSSGDNLPEPSTQIDTNEPNEQSAARPTTVNTPNYENTVGANAIMQKTEPSVTISIVPEPHKFTEPYLEMNFPHTRSQSVLKRRLSDNVSNDSFESREKRRLMMNDNQLAFGGNCSHDVNDNHANCSNRDVNPALINATVSQRKDHVERPTTSAQITSSVPADSSQKQIITKLFIVISKGIVCYETNDCREHKYASLSDCLTTLAGSELCKNGCEVVIQFYAGDTGIPFKYRDSGEKYKEFSTLGQLKSFAQQLNSIAFLWADVTVIAHFGPFKIKSNKSPSQFDYCSQLFSRERSMLKCKKLDVILVDNWPLSIVTNVVDRCDECDLQLEISHENNHENNDEFFEDIYELGVLQKAAVTLCIPDDDNAKEFMDKLKEKFRCAPQKCFKFEVFSQSKEVRKLSLKARNCILKATASKNYHDSVIIEQRAIGF
ncbi:hypothetical protein DdX_14261 [Ditylenchus destructor]|uniref:Uncharacterized protein n=1 Tax=Ditylenchus destructor TaxID=166010 RepID=A0AAD4QYR3_9BILA|nr:hypothetical protein DdX_14261 [Ditylenchus destructor]